MHEDNLNSAGRYAQTRTTVDNLSDPLARLIGGQDLWGRLKTFLLYSEAESHSVATINSYQNILRIFIVFMNGLGITMPEDVSEEHIVAFIIHKKKTCGGVTVNTYYNHARAWFNWMVRRSIEYSALS